MILEQMKGPFSAGQNKTFGGTDGRTYVKIGIQVPHRQPIGYSEKRAYLEKKSGVPSIEGDPIIDVVITTNEITSNHSINEPGIFEVEGNFGNMVTIGFPRSLPQGSIVDLLYKEEGE